MVHETLEITLAEGPGGNAQTIGETIDGGARTLSTDFCMSTIPVPIFKSLRTNLPASYMDAARKLPVQAAGKVGWQAERFWET